MRPRQDRIARGRLAIDRLTDACLDVVAAREPELLAWAFIDPAYCRRQASTLIDGLAKGQTPGRLLGVPVGVKDIFATADMPTANGTALHAGRQPAADWPWSSGCGRPAPSCSARP
ncbi:MAG: amidase family protein [Geminicoccaceae bacterium]